MPQKMKVLVETMESQLEFQILKSTTGRQLYEEVAKVLGVREAWFFSLKWIKGCEVWLWMDKKVSRQIKKLQQESKTKETDYKKVVDKTTTLEVPTLHFLVKYFPENVEMEVIHDNTLKLLYLQVKEQILNGSIKVCLQTAVLLASYASIVSMGPYQGEGLMEDGKIFKEQMLPKSSTINSNMSEGELNQQIIKWYAEHDIKLREDAMKEYVKVAQDVEMYGIEYYQVYNKNFTELCLGVHSLGLNLYEDSHKESPRLTLKWSEIHHLYSKNKRFLIRTLDQTSPIFCLHTTDKRSTQQILFACIGNHELYVKRRESDTLFHTEHILNLAELEGRRKLKESDSHKKSLEREIEARRRMEEETTGLKSELEEYQNHYEEALEELGKFKMSKKHEKESKEELKEIILKEKVEFRKDISKMIKKEFFTLKDAGIDGRMTQKELKNFNDELVEVKKRIKEIREDIGQYEQQVSSFMAPLFKKHHIGDDHESSEEDNDATDKDDRGKCVDADDEDFRQNVMGLDEVDLDGHSDDDDNNNYDDNNDYDDDDIDEVEIYK